MEDKKITRESVVYDTQNMIVTRWGARWAYWRYDVSNVPDEVRLYALKGFMQWAHENPTESEAFQLTWKKIMDENWNK